MGLDILYRLNIRKRKHQINSRQDAKAQDLNHGSPRRGDTKEKPRITLMPRIGNFPSVLSVKSVVHSSGLCVSATLRGFSSLFSAVRILGRRKQAPTFAFFASFVVKNGLWSSWRSLRLGGEVV